MKTAFVFIFITSALAVSRLDQSKFHRRNDDCPASYEACGDDCISSAEECCTYSNNGSQYRASCRFGSDSGQIRCQNEGDCAISNSSLIVISSSTSSTNIGATVTTGSSQEIATANSSACNSGWTACGQYCIPADYICCPDGQGGCDPDVARCWLGDDGRYGCCRNAVSSCRGAIGAATSITSESTTIMTSSTAFPAGVSTTTINTASPTSAIGRKSDGYQAASNSVASLMSLLMSAFAILL